MEYRALLLLSENFQQTNKLPTEVYVHWLLLQEQVSHLCYKIHVDKLLSFYSEKSKELILKQNIAIVVKEASVKFKQNEDLLATVEELQQSYFNE